jgi:hypothetical protein
LCVPREMNLELLGHQPFLGENDDWKACLMRTSGAA